MTQDVNPSVMERPLLAQRLGPHGPLPRRNIHQRVEDSITTRPTETSHQHQQRCGERSCRGPRGEQGDGGMGGGGGGVFEDQSAEIKRRMSDGCDLKPTSPPSASAVISALTRSVQKKYGRRFLSCTLHQKKNPGRLNGKSLGLVCFLAALCHLSSSSLPTHPPPLPRRGVA